MKHKKIRPRPRVSAENFVEVARLVHGDTYDYSKSVYVSIKDDVLITCKRHGDFWQRPGNHIHRAAGCGKCTKGDSPEEFFAKAAAKHNNFYDYGKSVYLESKSSVLVTCPVHGDFSVVAKRHVKGFGCARCSGHFTLTEKDFVDRAKSIYGDKFSYENVGFTGSQRPVTVTCKIHGDFTVRASYFLASRVDCELCAPVHRMTPRRFLHKARETHGDLYDYSLAAPTKVSQKVQIICQKHGVFTQNVGCHIDGQGCPRCSYRYGIPPDEWIEKARQVHSGRYGYERTQYKSCRESVIVTCSEHGDYEVNASDHMRGADCRSCAPSGFDRSAPASLYILVAPGLVKIGITNRSPEDRAKKINLSCDHNFTVHKHWQFEVGEHAEQTEKMSLALLRQTLQSPTEMFDGYTETFLNTTTEFVEQTITRVAQSLGLAI